MMTTRATKKAAGGPDETNGGSSLIKNTVVLHMVFHIPGLERPESSEKLNTMANKRWFGVRKKILESDTYKELAGISSSCKATVMRNEVPSRIFGHSYHLMPVSTIGAVMEQISEFERRYGEAADRFVSELDGLQAKAREELKEDYRETDYFSKRRMRAGFWVERELIEISIPSEGKVGSVISEIEMEKARVKWREAAKEATYVLREQFRGLVDHLRERLEPSKDGKKKAFHDSVLDNVKEWSALFASRDVIGDAELGKLIARTAEALKGVDREAIKSDDALRSNLESEMAKVTKSLDGLLVDKPARRIRFDD